MKRPIRLHQLFYIERTSRSCYAEESAIYRLAKGAMASRCIRYFLLALFIAASASGLLADDCSSSSASSVRLSASSYRNVTGHWITKAALIRGRKRDVSDLRGKERPLQYYVDVTRQSCGDDETLTTAFTVVVPPARVGADYAFFPNVGYYKLHTDKMNWENARRTCEREGAHLAVVNSEAEENAIREVMRVYSKENFPAFIGFHDMFKEGEYLTVLGDPLNSSGHVRWGKAEPNNKVSESSPEGEDCGNIYADGIINDTRCAIELAFVCEQSL